jgi:hypothetical protein
LSYFKKFKSEFLKQRFVLEQFERIVGTPQRHPFLKFLPDQDVTKQVVLLVPCDSVVAQGQNLLGGESGRHMVRCLAIASICASTVIPEESKEDYRKAAKASNSIFFSNATIFILTAVQQFKCVVQQKLQDLKWTQNVTK